MSDFIGSFGIGDAPGDFGQPYPQIDRDVVITGVFSEDSADIYGFLAPASGFATFTLSNLSDDLDIAVLNANQELLDGSFAGGSQTEVVRIALVRGALYYVDIESLVGASSSYRLTLDFAAVPQLRGTTSADTLTGGAQSEDLTGLEGNDLLLGGAGYDMAVYRDPAANFRFGEAGGQVLLSDTVTGQHNEGNDRLGAIEAVRFSDRTWRIELPATQGNPLLLRATIADEVIQVGGGGTLAIDTGGGIDTAVFRGQARDYSFELQDGAVVIRDTATADGNDGTRLLSNVEVLSFGDRDLFVTGGEFRVNTTAAASQAASTVAGRVDGGYTVAWTQISETGSEVLYQNFSAGGVKLGGERQISAGSGTQDGLPSIAGLAEGGFAMAWTREINGISDVVFARFDAAGDMIGNPGQVDAATGGDEGFTGVAELPNGRLAVAWSRASVGEQDWVVRLRLFDANNAPVGGTIQLSTTADGLSVAPSMVTLGSGGVVVCWVRLDAQFRSHSMAQVFNGNGTAVTEAFEVATPSDPVDGIFTGIDVQDGEAVANFALLCAPRVAATADGGFAVLAQRFTGGTGTLELHRFSASGVASGTTVVAGGAVTSDLIVLSDGTLVVTWAQAGDSLLGADTDVYQQRFDGQGQAKAPASRVNSTTNAVQLLPDSAALAEGGYVVTWTSEGQDLGDLGLYAQQYQQNGEVVRIEVRGTEGDDVLFYIGEEPMRALGLGGNDLYLVERTADQTIEAPGAGTDTVKSGLDWTLGANIENLELSGPALTGTGNEQRNEIRGTDAANRLDGRAGADTLSGGAGNDTYFVDNAADVVIETAIGPTTANNPDAGSTGGGIDTVVTQISYTLTSNVEILQQAGSSNLTGTGNTLANTLIGNTGDNNLIGSGGMDTLEGNAGNDTLNGGAGADRLIGGVGNDTYLILAGDTVVEDAGAGADTARSSASWTLAANVESLILLGSAQTRGTGNALPNTITGSPGPNLLAGLTGNDTLQGGDGSDTLAGGLGKDSLTGGPGADDFLFNTAAGRQGADIVRDFIRGADQILLDNDIYTAFTGTGALTALRFASGPGMSRAPNADVRLAYDTTTGILYYDPDGLGGQASPSQIAQFLGTSGPPSLTSADFLIVD